MTTAALPAEFAQFEVAPLVRRRPVFTPCSPRHKGCTPAHVDLMDAWRVAKEANRREIEEATLGYKGDLELWVARGQGRVLTFREFISHR